MKFKGPHLSLEEILNSSEKIDESPVSYSDDLRSSAYENASDTIFTFGKNLEIIDLWRFAVLQTLDDYNSSVKRGGVTLGARVFENPVEDSVPYMKVSLAGLASYLSEKDGWETPSWVNETNPLPEPWFPNVLSFLRDDALEESPNGFRKFNIFVTLEGLTRA